MPNVWQKLVDAPAANRQKFGEKLAIAFEASGQLCVGIDPHAYLLGSWGLEDTAQGLKEFGLRVVDACVGQASIVKPQIAFFERHGSAGYRALEAVLAAARAAGLVVIADVKRGDLGTTVEAYAEAWLRPGSPLEVDAITVNAYMGVGSLAVPMQQAEDWGKGLFVLAATSNPEALELQTSRLSFGTRVGASVASTIVSDVGQWNTARGSGAKTTEISERPPTAEAKANGDPINRYSNGAIGSIGLVLGATIDFSAFGLDLAEIAQQPAPPILAPGFGHQGANFADFPAIYGPLAPYTVVSASRSILSAGPLGVAEAVRVQAAEVAECRA